MIIAGRILREGRIFERYGPVAVEGADTAELVERLIGIHRIAGIRIGAVIRHRRQAGFADARLIQEIDTVALAQEDVLESFTAVRRRFPGTRCLGPAGQEDHAVMMSILRFLIKDIGMVPVGFLSLGFQKMLIRIGTVMFDRRPADGKAALRFQDDRFLCCCLRRDSSRIGCPSGAGQDAGCQNSCCHFFPHNIQCSLFC